MMSPERAALSRDDTYNYVSPLWGSTSPRFQPRAHARGYFLPAHRASNSSFAKLSNTLICRRSPNRSRQRPGNAVSGTGPRR